MGNANCDCCCDEAPKQEILDEAIVVKKVQFVKIPEMLPPVQYHLQEYKPFMEELDQHASVRKFGNDVYQGRLNNRGKPDGYGIMFKKNGTVFVGLFDDGIANGIGHFVLHDGSYYHGNFSNNQAEAQEGEFVSKHCKYKGGFKNNLFDGAGREEGDGYTYKGTFKNGNRLKGELAWQQKNSDSLKCEDECFMNIYKGQFGDEGRFCGKGLLKTEKGSYEGQFKDGEKDGSGIFYFSSGLRYQGQYKQGLKHGIGTLFGKNGTITYSGQWQDNMPHGSGFIINPFGDKINLNWVEGLDKRILPDEDNFQLQ